MTSKTKFIRDSQRNTTAADESFTCLDCGKTEPIGSNHGCGTGYATLDNGDKVCYTCCAVRDRQYMRDYGRITLYLSQHGGKWQVTNWPGTLRFLATVRQSNHNMVGKNGRTDAWFTFDNHVWHGVQIGHYSQLCRCKQTQRKE